LAAAAALGGAGTGGGSIGDTGSAILGGNSLGGSIATAGNGTPVDSSLTFDINPDGVTNGPSKIPETVGSTGATLVLACDASGVSGSTWTCSTGGTLTESGSGASPSLVDSPFTDGSPGVKYAVDANAKTHAASSASLADITTEDLVVEYIGNMVQGNSGTGMPLFKSSGVASCSAGFAGWYLGQGSTTARFCVGDGTDATSVSFFPSTSTVFHAMGFFDRDSASGLVACLNGTCVAGVNGTAVDSMTSAQALRIGLTSSIQATTVYAVRIWKCAGCLNTADFTTISQEHFRKAVGLYPATAAGSAAPTTVTRATVKNLDIDTDQDGVRRLFPTYNTWIGTARRKELTGGEYVEGILIEPSHTNLCLRSETFANASWTENSIDAVAEGTTQSPRMIEPDNTGTADTLESTDAAGSVEHFMRQGITLTATTYTASVYVKAGADTTVTHAWVRDNTVANAIGWVQLSDCAAGTKGAGASQLHAENWGNGWCRVGITFTGTVAAHSIDIGYSDADNATAFDDGTDSDSDLIVWGAQVEAQVLPLSYVATTTASAASNADDLRYAAASNASNTAGTMVLGLMMAPRDISTNDTYSEVYTDVNNYVRISANSTTDTAQYAVVSGGAPQATASGATPVDNGERNEVQVYWTTNRARGYFNGTAMDAENTSVTVPAGTAATIYVGQSGSVLGVRSYGTIYSRLRIYNEVRTP
jgi:hypothetical protein